MDWITVGVPLLTTLLGSGFGAAFIRWRHTRAQLDVEAERTKRHEAKNQTTIAVLDRKAEQSERDWYRDRIAEQDAKIERGHRECEEKLEQAEEKCREHTAEQIEQAISPFRDAFRILVGKARDSHGPDDTGVHALEAVLRRATPQPFEAVRDTPSTDPEEVA